MTPPHVENHTGTIAGVGPGSDRCVAETRDNGAALVNPEMGWCFHHYDNSIGVYGGDLDPADTLEDFPGLSTVYLRLAWSHLEPEDGVYDWSVLDSVAQRYIARGLRFALRLTTCENALPFATPRWVFDAGARSVRFGRPERHEPDYDDPVFMRYLTRFLERAGERYGGDPNLDYVDVGSFGVWGEGHTHLSSKLPFSTRTAIEHIDLHRRCFPDTLLAVLDETAQQGRGNAVLEHARKHGMTIREDSALVFPESVPAAWVAQQFWASRPVIVECEHYGDSERRGLWGDGSGYVDAIAAYHASFATIHWYPREFLDVNREMIDRINRMLGYRIRPQRVEWSRTACPGGSIAVRTQWVNTGVAPCYPGGSPCFTLKTERGGIAAVLVDETTDARAIPVGAPAGSAHGVQPGVSDVLFRVPSTLQNGAYRLFVSVGRGAGTPTIRMPLDGDDGAGRYEIGTITVTDEI